MFNAYGFVFSHPDGGGVGEAPADWLPVLVQRTAPARYPIAEPLRLSDGYAAMQFREGWLEVFGKGPLAVRVASHGLRDEALVHPYLALPAAVLAHWTGAVPLHAGAVATPNGAIAVIATKGGGKSTTMAALAAAGLPVMTDDLLVVRGGDVLCGPRIIDLRRDAARSFGGRPLGTIGARERWRIDLPPAPAVLPLAAIVELVWADELSVTRLRAVDRLDLLTGAYALGTALASPGQLLALARVPVYRLGRPRHHSHLAGVLEHVTGLVA